MLIHITEESRLPSITKHGLVSPAEAAKLGFSPVFGSRGSNQDVVQLLDLTGLTPQQIITSVEALIDDATANGGSGSVMNLHVLFLDETLRNELPFVLGTAYNTTAGRAESMVTSHLGISHA